MNGYFGWLIAFLVASLAVVASQVVSPGAPKGIAFVAMLPLIAYHCLLKARIKTLAASAVDSVYYFGFLITVGELGATALEIARNGNPGDYSVLYNFGVGLLATGYAVIARLHLQNASRPESPTSPEAALDSYLERSGLLLDNMETTIRRFAVLAETAMIETKRVVDNSRDMLEDSLGSAARDFEKQMRQSLTSAREATDAVRTILQDASFASERADFLSITQQSLAASQKLVSALDELRTGAERGAGGLARASDRIDTLARSVDILDDGVTKLVADNGGVARVARSLEDAATSAKEAATSVQRTGSCVEQLAGTVAVSQSAFASAGKAATNVEAQMDGMATACGRLQASAARLEGVLKASDKLGESLDSLDREIRPVSSNLTTLGHGITDLKSALGSAAGSLEDDVERSTAAVGRLADSLTTLAEIIIERTSGKRATV